MEASGQQSVPAGAAFGKDNGLQNLQPRPANQEKISFSPQVMSPKAPKKIKLKQTSLKISLNPQIDISKAYFSPKVNSEPRTRFETTALNPHKQHTEHPDALKDRFSSPLSSSRIVSQPDQSTQAQSRDGFSYHLVSDQMSRQCDTAD